METYTPTKYTPKSPEYYEKGMYAIDYMASKNMPVDDEVNTFETVFGYNFLRQKNVISVSKKISDMLQYTDMDRIDPKLVVFPSNSFVITFEDKSFGDILVSTPEFNDEKLRKYITRYGEGFTILTHVGKTPKESESFTMTLLGRETLERMLGDAKNDFNFHKTHIDSRNYEGDVDETQTNVHTTMFLKLMLLLTCESFGKNEVKKVNTIKIRDKTIRSVSKTINVVYLPSIRREADDRICENTGKIMPPHIRRGHFRTLRDERYGDNRGKVIFIAPVYVNGFTDEMPMDREYRVRMPTLPNS